VNARVKGKGLLEKAESILIKKDGPLTRELLLKPGRFGLGKVPDRFKPDATTTMVCGFCSTGCGLNVHLKEGSAVNLTADTEYPVNLGMACPKGWEALTPLAAPDRATTPLLRSARGKLEPVSWQEALSTFTDRFKAIQQAHGPESIAFLGTGQMPSEELAFLGSLGKFGMGMVHGDGNTRQCMATAVVAYKQAFGFDAPPYTYQDFEESDVIVLVGANLCIAHPIMWERVCRNKNNPRIIVVDPRRTETAMAATDHIAPAPKTDLALFYGVAHLLIENGQIDRAFIEANTTGFDEFATHVKSHTPAFVEGVTGVPAAQIQALADAIAQGKRVSFWWTMGVNQSHQGVRTAQALVNLALMTGNIGRPGTGANSITGQCNAMGSRLFSNTTNLLGGHDFANPEHRNKIASVLGIDEARIPQKASLAYDQILEEVLRGKIKGLWIVATNPAHSWINQGFFETVRDRLDFLVVQDMYTSTETAKMADLLLPAAGWGEKEGTFINSERRIGLLQRVARAPGQALSDFSIFRLVAEAWGCGDLFERWSSPEKVFEILQAVSAGQPCDITGIEGYEMLNRLGGVQWPCPKEGRPTLERQAESNQANLSAAGNDDSTDEPNDDSEDVSEDVSQDIPTEHPNQRRLFSDGKFYHPDQKAKFLFVEHKGVPEKPNKQYPLLLLTGRGTSAQWHTQTRTGKSEILRRLGPRALYVEISVEDAKARRILPGELVSVRSRRATITARAFVTNNVKPGHVFLPMHENTVNRLTFPAFDPHSRQPAYKASAVEVEPHIS